MVGKNVQSKVSSQDLQSSECGISGDSIDFVQKMGSVKSGDVTGDTGITSGCILYEGDRENNQKTLLSRDEIKRIAIDGGYRYHREHLYKTGNPPYMKVIYKNTTGDKEARFSTLEPTTSGHGGDAGKQCCTTRRC